jgi:hypothetical protein
MLLSNTKRENYLINRIDAKAALEAIRRGSPKKGHIKTSGNTIKRRVVNAGARWVSANDLKCAW